MTILWQCEPSLCSYQVSYLSYTGGDMVNDCVANITTKLMSNDLAKQHYTWVGRSENKKSFCDLSLKQLVTVHLKLTVILDFIIVVILIMPDIF